MNLALLIALGLVMIFALGVLAGSTEAHPLSSSARNSAVGHLRAVRVRIAIKAQDSAGPCRRPAPAAGGRRRPPHAPAA